MEKSFDKYLEIENLLNKFFDKYNFCVTSCTMNRTQKEWIGCCTKDYFNDFFDKFNEKRVEIYWKAQVNTSKCWYHCSTGCKLKTHKAPICLWFICSEFTDYLKDKGIKRNPNEIIKILSELIDWYDKNYEYLKGKLEAIIEK